MVKVMPSPGLGCVPSWKRMANVVANFRTPMRTLEKDAPCLLVTRSEASRRFRELRTAVGGEECGIGGKSSTEIQNGQPDRSDVGRHAIGRVDAEGPHAVEVRGPCQPRVTVGRR